MRANSCRFQKSCRLPILPLKLIRDKRAAEANKVVKTFPEDEALQILNGRYGVYISYNKGNYKIPKTVDDPAALTLEECRRIIADSDAKPKRPKGRKKA